MQSISKFDSNSQESREIIKFDAISKQYPTIKALDNISFSIKKGEIFCLLGPNGSGKTTSIKLITGQIKPSMGHVYVNGEDPIGDRKKLIGFYGLVPQEIALYGELTARENLEFHGQLYHMKSHNLESRIEELLKVAGLENRQNERVETFSGGMKRRLQLVRALIHDPDVLLLDEPTLGIDVQSRNAINEHILKIAEMGKTVILTTNYMEEAEKLADRLVILDNKMIMAPASLKEVQETVLPGAMLLFDTLVSDQVEGFEQILCNDIQGEIIKIRSYDSKIGYQIRTPLNPQKALKFLLDSCKKHEVSIVGLTVKTPSLEDVFLQLTGKEFRDNE